MDQLPSKPPNYAEIIREILISMNGPIAIEDLAARILAARPSNAKNPHLAALTKIREEQGRQLVYLDLEHVHLCDWHITALVTASTLPTKISTSRHYQSMIAFTIIYPPISGKMIFF
jgi:hypothetical protein